MHAHDQQHIENRLEARLQSFLEKRGHELVELTYRRERPGWVLRLSIEGVDIDRAAQISRDVGAYIEGDPELEKLLAGPYHLEVSSPGLFRKLKRPRDFELAWQKRVKIQWEAEPGRSLEVKGIVQAYGDGKLILKNDDHTTLEIAADKIRDAQLDPQLPFGKAK